MSISQVPVDGCLEARAAHGLVGLKPNLQRGFPAAYLPALSSPPVGRASARLFQGLVVDGCLCLIGHKHAYLADQIMPYSSLSPSFPLGQSPFHVCPMRHNPDMGCFSLLVYPRRKGEAYDRARLY